MNCSRINKIIAIWWLLFLIFTSFCSGQEILIYGNNAKPPKVWLDQGKPKGLLIDILKHLEPTLGVTFKFVLFPWKRAYNNMLYGKGGLIGLSKNDERLKVIDYSEAMFIDEIIVVVIKGNEFPYQKIDDLKGKTVGIQSGASYGSEFEKAKKTIFIPEYDHGSVSRLLMLLKGRIDIALINPGRPALDNFLRADPSLWKNRDKFVVLENPYKKDPNYLGFAKTANYKGFLLKFNIALQEAKQSGAIDRIVSNYIK